MAVRFYNKVLSTSLRSIYAAAEEGYCQPETVPSVMLELSQASRDILQSRTGRSRRSHGQEVPHVAKLCRELPGHGRPQPPTVKASHHGPSLSLILIHV